MNHLERNLTAEFINIERENIKHNLRHFFRGILQSQYIHRDVDTISQRISDIFITWDDYEQFMKDHQKSFCREFQDVLQNFDFPEFGEQKHNIINGILAPMIGNDTQWLNVSDNCQVHKIKG